jgi:molybdopterin synthase sulfur carrier subunit
MIVYIPSPLRSYTKNVSQVDVDPASSLFDLTKELDGKYPGIRFRMIDEQDRIREHIKIFVNRAEVKSLDVNLQPSDIVHITCALSGG